MNMTKDEAIMNICKVDECKSDLYAKGFCVKHYARNKRNGSPHALKEPKSGKLNFFVDSNGYFVVSSHKPDAKGYPRSEEHTSELQSRFDLVCRLLLEKKK